MTAVVVVDAVMDPPQPLWRGRGVYQWWGWHIVQQWGSPRASPTGVWLVGDEQCNHHGAVRLAYHSLLGASLNCCAAADCCAAPLCHVELCRRWLPQCIDVP